MRWIVGVVGAAGCAGGDASGTDSGAPTGIGTTGDFPEAWAALEDEVLELVNQHRFVGGDCGGRVMPPSEPLEDDPILRQVARTYSRRMAVEGFFDHVDPQGTTPDERVYAAGFDGSPPIGENIAGGYPTAEDVVAGWLASPGHCRNMLDPIFRAIGVGYYFEDGDLVGHYWTQNFAASH